MDTGGYGVGDFEIWRLWVPPLSFKFFASSCSSFRIANIYSKFESVSVSEIQRKSSKYSNSGSILTDTQWIFTESQRHSLIQIRNGSDSGGL